MGCQTRFPSTFCPSVSNMRVTFCKVIIGQQGGFARMAYVLSRNSEMFITPEESLYELFRKIGRGNKYDISLNKTDD